jgi:DNA topoisomerase IB
LCFEALSRRGNVRADERAAVVTEVVKGVAAQLGHTAAVCEQYYIDRQVISSYLDGRLCGRREAT